MGRFTDKFYSFVEKYASKISTWCWHKRVSILRTKQKKKGIKSFGDLSSDFGANVKFYDPFVKGGCELNDVLRDADLVSVHVPLSDETKNLLGKSIITEEKILQKWQILKS